MNLLYVVLLFLTLCHYSVHSQELKKQPLNIDTIKGVAAYYEYNGPFHHTSQGLILFESGRYFYRTVDFGTHTYSEGKWTIKNRELKLTSDIVKKNDLPVTIDYMNNVSGSSNKGVMATVKNKKGDVLPEAFVFINNDTVKCFPDLDTCVGAYNKIDSIKVEFGDGFSSKWIQIEQKDYKQLQVTLQLDIKLPFYEVFDQKRYQVRKSSIRRVE